jgi:glycosyltransferase involved in cell wall biosynthesis
MNELDDAGAGQTASLVQLSSAAVDLTVVILTYNEEVHIERAISEARRLTRNIVVVDSFSTDRTIELARSAGAGIAQNVFVNHSEQFQWALENVAIETEWVMRLDADETLTRELVEEIRTRLPILSSEICGVNLKRRHVFLGRWIRHGGRYPLILLRIWRNGAARIETRWMDEHMMLLRGRSITFEHDFSDHNLNDLAHFTAKHNKYATHEAIDRLGRRYALFARDRSVTDGASGSQARLKRMVKEGVYNHIPFALGPIGYFFWRYFFRLGLLDGREGLVYHFLQGLWYRFLVEARVFELRRAVASLEDKDAIRSRLSALTGLSID